MSESTEGPRIYVASLTDYNAGTLRGVWVDLWADGDSRFPKSGDDVFLEVSRMLALSPEAARFPQGGSAEEYAIHDYEGFGSIRLSEYESFDKVAELAAAIEEHGAGPVAAFVGNFGSWDAEAFEEAYLGEFDDLASYAEEFATQCGFVTDNHLSEWPFTCIDWNHAGRELEMGGDIWTDETDAGTILVFRNA